MLPRPMGHFIMRTKLVLAALLALSASVPGVAAISPGTAPQVKPVSQALSDSGFAALQKGETGAAIDQFETALAVDPMNGRAFIGLARAAQAQGLPGKAIKFYREALTVDPNDLDALEGQGAALASRGATARAQVNLARIKKLCGEAACPSAKRLEVAIANGVPPAKAVAAATPAPATAPAPAVTAEKPPANN